MSEHKQINGMVDVTDKDVTKRVAIASSQIQFSPDAFQILITKGSPKGDIFETAKVAGILAAKATPTLIPMCHPLPLNKVKVTFDVDKGNNCVVATAEVVCQGKTGIEMEALTAASVATLTIYDMMKWADKGMVISETKLLHKSGGKTGDFHRD